MERLRPTIYMLIGPPASGKSTWRAKHLATAHRPTVVISSDDYIDEIARENNTTYSDAFRKADMKAITRVLNNQFDEAVKRGDDIILDRTNMSAKSRNKYLCRVPKAYRKVAVNFSVGRELLDRRLADRAAATGKHIPKEVVDDMIKSFDEPSSREFDEVIQA